MAKPSPGEFVRQVRQETSKVTWPTRKEAVTTSIMVMIMVTIMSLFFLGVDQLLAIGIEWLLSFGG
jgi:preprotein translocase subunit SecE